MKAFIIHTPHQKSIEYAQLTLDSFANFSGWEPELFEGLTPNTLPDFEKEIHIKTRSFSRAKDFFCHDKKRFVIKKCCSLNHYRLFKRCIGINQPIAIVEHDSACVGSWQSPDFSGVLVLNAMSALTQSAFAGARKQAEQQLKDGVQPIQFSGIKCRHNPLLRNAYVMPGTAAYAITPDAASTLVEVYEDLGWEQSDLMINTASVTIETLIPELFTFGMPNLQMSHGKNFVEEKLE